MKKTILLFMLTILVSSNVFCLYLGDGTDTYQKQPIFVMNDIIDVYSDGFTTLFLKDDNSLWGCGDNTRGQLGTKEATTYNYPIKIMDNVISFCCNYGTVSYVTQEGELYLLGLVPQKLRENDTIEYIKTSGPILYANNVLKCFVSKRSFFYITNENDLYSFGENFQGRLGDGSEIPRITPKIVLQNVKDITATDNGVILILDINGNVYQCFKNIKKVFSNAKKIKGYFLLTDQNDLYVRGYNLYGSLGLEVGKNYIEYTFLMENVHDMDSDQDHSLIITNDNNLFVCGGGNIHETKKATGDGECHYSPFQIKGINNCDKAYVGGQCSFVITKDKQLWAFGANSKNDYSGL